MTRHWSGAPPAQEYEQGLLHGKPSNAMQAFIAKMKDIVTLFAKVETTE